MSVSQRYSCRNPTNSSCPGLVPGIHVLKTALHKKKRGWPGHWQAEATPSFGRMPGHDAEETLRSPMSLLAKISPASDARSARLAGIALMLVSVGIFAFGDTLGKFIVATYSVGQLLLLRGAAALIVLAPLIWRRRREFLHLERPRLQLFRVVLSTLEVAAFFLATVYLPLSDVVAYYLACPIFVTALSAIVLRERVGWRRWSAIVIGFCGVLIALRPSAQTVSWPAMIALAGSMAFAGLMLIPPSLRATPHPRPPPPPFTAPFV